MLAALFSFLFIATPGALKPGVARPRTFCVFLFYKLIIGYVGGGFHRFHPWEYYEHEHQDSTDCTGRCITEFFHFEIWS